MAHHLIWRPGVKILDLVQLRGGLLHQIGYALHHEGCLFSGFWSFRPFGVVRALPNFHNSFYRIQIYPNRRAFSNTHSPCGPFCHCTNILCQPLIASFRHLFDSPCSWRIWDCCLHYLCAFFPTLVGRHHCVSIHLVRHAQGADSPPCTTSGCPIEWSSTHWCGFLRQSALIVGRRRKVASPGCILLFGLARTSML